MILCVERSVGHVGEIMIRGNGRSATSYHNLPPLELVTRCVFLIFNFLKCIFVLYHFKFLCFLNVFLYCIICATSYHNLPLLELVKWSPLVYFCDEDAFVRLDFVENFHSVSTTFDIFTLVNG